MLDIHWFGAIIAFVASAVFIIYKYQVLRAVLSDGRGAARQVSNEDQDARTLHQASAARASELEMGRIAHRRMGPMQLETLRLKDAPNNTTTLLATNAGGIARDIAVAAGSSQLTVTPASVEPDDEVQLTFLNVDENARSLPFSLEYVNAAGQPARCRYILNRATGELRPD